MNQKSNWIDVRDRLPKKDVPVWLFYPSRVVVGILEAELGYGPMWICYFEDRDPAYSEEVTHWLPMSYPEPPTQIGIEPRSA